MAAGLWHGEVEDNVGQYSASKISRDNQVHMRLTGGSFALRQRQHSQYWTSIEYNIPCHGNKESKLVIGETLIKIWLSKQDVSFLTKVTSCNICDGEGL